MTYTWHTWHYSRTWKFPHSANVSPKPFTQTSNFPNTLMSREFSNTKCLLLPFTHLVQSDKYSWRCRKFPLVEGCSDPSTANNRLLEISNPFALIFIPNKSPANVIFYWLHARLSFILCWMLVSFTLISAD